VCPNESNFYFQDVIEIVKDVQELGVNPIEAQRVTYQEANKKDGKALFIAH